LRLVRNVVSFNDADAAGDTERRTKCEYRALTRLVGLNVPVGRVVGFPDAVHIRFAIRHAGSTGRGGRLGRRRHDEEENSGHRGYRPSDQGDLQPIPHGNPLRSNRAANWPDVTCSSGSRQATGLAPWPALAGTRLKSSIVSERAGLPGRGPMRKRKI